MVTAVEAVPPGYQKINGKIRRLPPKPSRVATAAEQHRAQFGERSEEDILTRAPVKVTLGGKRLILPLIF